MTERQRYAVLIRDNIKRSLSETRSWHVDQIDFEIPRQHKNLVGNLTGQFVRGGFIEEYDRRPTTKRASNARKSGVYRPTPKGLKRLAGGGADPVPRVSSGRSPRPSGSRPRLVSSPSRARLPHSSDPAVRAQREDAFMDAVDHFEFVTPGAISWWAQDELAVAA